MSRSTESSSSIIPLSLSTSSISASPISPKSQFIRNCDQVFNLSKKRETAELQNLLNEVLDVDERKRIVNTPNKNGKTPLLNATLEGVHKTVRVLLEFGADVNAPTEGRETYVFIAVFHGYYETVRVLVEFGANIHIKVENQTPLEIAMELSQNGIVSLLEKYKKLGESLKRIFLNPEMDNHTKIGRVEELNKVKKAEEEAEKEKAKKEKGKEEAKDERGGESDKEKGKEKANKEKGKEESKEEKEEESTKKEEILLPFASLLNMPLDERGNTIMHEIVLDSGVTKILQNTSLRDRNIDLLDSLAALGGKLDVKNSNKETAIDLARKYGGKSDLLARVEAIHKTHSNPELVKEEIRTEAGMIDDVVGIIGEYIHLDQENKKEKESVKDESKDSDSNPIAPSSSPLSPKSGEVQKNQLTNTQ